MTKNIRKDGRVCLQKNLAKPKEIVTKNKSGNPDSTNNSLALPEERLIMKSDNLQLIQAITAENKRKHKPNGRVPCLRRSTY